jgi:hypothetical protein
MVRQWDTDTGVGGESVCGMEHQESRLVKARRVLPVHIMSSCPPWTLSPVLNDPLWLARTSQIAGRKETSPQPKQTSNNV